MKKLLALLACTAVVFSVAGCGKSAKIPDSVPSLGSEDVQHNSIIYEEDGSMLFTLGDISYNISSTLWDTSLFNVNDESVSFKYLSDTNIFITVSKVDSFYNEDKKEYAYVDGDTTIEQVEEYMAPLYSDSKSEIGETAGYPSVTFLPANGSDGAAIQSLTTGILVDGDVYLFSLMVQGSAQDHLAEFNEIIDSVKVNEATEEETETTSEETESETESEESSSSSSSSKVSSNSSSSSRSSSSSSSK